MIGSLSKLRFIMEVPLAGLVPGFEGRRNLASAMFALSLRASSQVRSTNAGTTFSKPEGSLSFALK
jgi:hypothetical protein